MGSQCWGGAQQGWGHVGTPPLWHTVLAILGHTVLACMRAALGVQHPDLVG